MEETMRAFSVKAGTDVRMVPVETYSGGGFMALRDYTTQKDKMFFVEDIVIDPTGINKDASTPDHKSTVGGAYAAGGWYGFALADPHRYPKGAPGSKWYAVLVPASKVEVN
jgi:hypothetical protein